MADLRTAADTVRQSSPDELPSSSAHESSANLDDIFGGHVESISPQSAQQSTNHRINAFYPVEAPANDSYQLSDLVAVDGGSLSSIIPRENVMYLVTMFFEFVYPLQPVVHQNSFMSQLHAQREDSDPVFRSLLASILAVALIHVPKAFVPYDDSLTISDLANRCLRLSRICTLSQYDPPSSSLVVTRYFHAVYYFMTGQRAAWVASLAESTRLALFMELHRESTYAGLDPVTAEMRRRLVHTLVNADASAACMQDQILALNTDDVDVAVPEDLPDEYAHPAKSDEATKSISRLAGFRASSATLRLIREGVILRRLLGRTNPPSRLLDIAIQLRSIHDRLNTVFTSLHPVFRSRSNDDPLFLFLNDTGSFGSPPSANINADHRNIFGPDDSGLNELAMAHQVMKANLHTTRAVARMLLINCREELLNNAGPKGSPGRNGIEIVLSNAAIHGETMESNITDLLNALTSIPIQAVSANSHSLVNKVRSVVVTLLDSSRNNSDLSGLETSTEQYEGVLMSFLTLLTQIENLCSVVPMAV